jgi:hypothetical protein
VLTSAFFFELFVKLFLGANFVMEEPLLLFCLRDATHDWRLLQLVNRSMCAVYRQWMKSEIDGVLVSVQSEVDGNKAECVRNELWALFDVWVGWGEQHRKVGREIMIDKLYADGLRLESKMHVGWGYGPNGCKEWIIVWHGRRVERTEYGQVGHNAARNGMVSLLRQELLARGRWPVPARPRSDPQHLHAVL